MQGKIIKGISGFYYVHVMGSGIYECKAKGIFRSRNIKPLIGDCVEIDLLDEAEKKGNVIEIYPRKNALIRPAVANIDQALLVFAITEPSLNYYLLDRFLVMMGCWQIPAVICFNKIDLVTEEKQEEACSVYRNCGYPVVLASVKDHVGIERVLELLKGKTTAAAGPSGVGKSSLINMLQDGIRMEVGEISRKIGRGKNTTRHSMLIPIKEDTYIMDTPGFGSLDLPNLSVGNLWSYYHEFLPFEPFCKFTGCSHRSEPECGIKAALKEEKIHPKRYENYVNIYQELKERKHY